MLCGHHLRSHAIDCPLNDGGVQISIVEVTSGYGRFGALVGKRVVEIDKEAHALSVG